MQKRCSQCGCPVVSSLRDRCMDRPSACFECIACNSMQGKLELTPSDAEFPKPAAEIRRRYAGCDRQRSRNFRRRPAAVVRQRPWLDIRTSATLRYQAGQIGSSYDCGWQMVFRKSSIFLRRSVSDALPDSTIKSTTRLARVH
jgi:hypothetical protein